MTRKLYYDNSMMSTFSATVLDCCFDSTKKTYIITLDQSAFFPTGGGQVSDKGFFTLEVSGEICKYRVSDVVLKGEDVLHYTDKEIKPGSLVTGEIDWSDRFSKMQQHTGEHILSGLIFKEYGLNNVGFHLGDENVTMDLDGELTYEDLMYIEELANDIVVKNLDIEVIYPNEEELASINYRSKMEIKEQVRLVQIPSVDTCACCAPHVKSTGMIGMIKITDFIKHRGGLRINIACGNRALMDYRNKMHHIKNVSSLLSLKEDKIFEGVNKLNNSHQELKNSYIELSDKLVSLEIKKRSYIKEDVVTNISDLFSLAQNKKYVSELSDDVKVVVSFAKLAEGSYHFIAASNVLDMRELASIVKENYDFKGGGNRNLVQGNLLASENDVVILCDKFRSECNE